MNSRASSDYPGAEAGAESDGSSRLVRRVYDEIVRDDRQLGLLP